MKLRSVFWQVLAAALGGLLLARTLYATAWGQAVLGLVPERLWSAVFGALGLQGAESTSNVEITLVLLSCVAAAGVVVSLVARALRLLGARPERPDCG